MAGAEAAVKAPEVSTVPAPPGFDSRASIVASNFPADATTTYVGALFSWYAPVVHVEHIEPDEVQFPGGDDNAVVNGKRYCVTFVDRSSAERVLEQALHYPDGFPGRMHVKDSEALAGRPIKMCWVQQEASWF
eukprot:gnl/TRDRNA2_/TRDRNA2_198290_c0_seq1.p1 gnl/TRDRNA2_/TRDRNA2_198290_c0~~gnl/TRDRNA2_/TRDRNA2_198290_c0_seq1.p1  ORF type:complete len:133 (+),score=18.64 gnl/TRDRNA2_/TRDRNA2_198290_c0_seq1:59-457(+)